MIQKRGKGPSQKVRDPNFGKGSILFLARPRELRGRMVKGIVPIQSPHLTQREADGGESAHFWEVFSLWVFTPTAANARR